MSNPRRQKRAEPSAEVKAKIRIAKLEESQIDSLPDGKEKFAAKKAWLVKYAAILSDMELYERWLNSVHDYPTYSDGKRPERASLYGGELSP